MSKKKQKPKRRSRARSAGRAVWSSGQRRLLAGIAGLILLLGLALGMPWLTRYYLLHSGRFVLRHIDVEAGDTVTRERICEYLRLQEGMPLFGIKIYESQQQILKDSATIKSLTIKRHLPDRIHVCAIEREPLARLARQALVVDEAGYIFPRYVGIETLPCISGYPQREIKPGTRVSGMALAAIELFEVLQNNNLPLQIVDVDVSHQDYLACTMSDLRYVKLSWKYLGDNNARSKRFLLAQLKGLADAMNSERGLDRSRWDATIPGRVYGAR